MSEYMFGITRKKLTKAVLERRDKICNEEGGYGYSQIDQSHGTAEGGNWLGWFSGPNRGNPFDGDLERRVMARVREAEDDEEDDVLDEEDWDDE